MIRLSHLYKMEKIEPEPNALKLGCECTREEETTMAQAADRRRRQSQRPSVELRTPL